MLNIPLKVNFTPSAKVSKEVRALHAKNRKLRGVIENLDKSLKQAPALCVSVDFKKEFWNAADELRKNVFSIAGMVLRGKFGENFTAAYWAAGIDFEPAQIMGGRWFFVDTADQHLATKQHSHDTDKTVKEAGYTPLKHDVNHKTLPAKIGWESQDVCMIKTPGSSYFYERDFREGLWTCASQALRPNGVLVTTEPIHEMSEDLEGAEFIRWCLERFKQINLCEIEEPDFLEYSALEVPWERSRSRIPRIYSYPVALYVKSPAPLPHPEVIS
jgi:hypothetical protein